MGSGNAGIGGSVTSKTAIKATLAAQLTSAAPIHVPGTSGSVPLDVAVGLMLVGGIAVGPTRRRYHGRAAHAVAEPTSSGRHFRRK
ncbi:MAG TPA: hypothetical protein VHT75_06235 [Acidimicrobiales bacterium]|nr:hypothetical protein [Acidimicrobiales bacterium]